MSFAIAGRGSAASLHAMPVLVAIPVLVAVLVLAGCAQSTPQSHANAAQQAACRQRADEVYQIQNRGANYTADAYVSGSRDTPFSAAGATGDTSSGLPARYSRDTIYNDCINGVGGPAGGGPQAPTPPEPAPPPPAP